MFVGPGGDNDHERHANNNNKKTTPQNSFNKRNHNFSDTDRKSTPCFLRDNNHRRLASGIAVNRIALVEIEFLARLQMSFSASAPTVRWGALPYHRRQPTDREHNHHVHFGRDCSGLLFNVHARIIMPACFFVLSFRSGQYSHRVRFYEIICTEDVRKWWD